MQKVIRSKKNVLTDLLYSTLEILYMLACSANLLAVYILCTVKICGEYLAVKSHLFEFVRLTLWLTLNLAVEILDISQVQIMLLKIQF